MLILIEGHPYGPFRDAQDAQVFADTYFEGDWQGLDDNDACALWRNQAAREAVEQAHAEASEMFEVETFTEVLIQALAFILVGFGIWTAAIYLVNFITGGSP